MKTKINEVTELIEKDAAIKKKYINYLNRRLVVSAVIAASMHLIYYILRTNLSTYALGAVPVLYLLIFWIPAQFIFLAYAYCKALKQGVSLSNGQLYKPFYRVIYYTLLNTLACTPSVIGIMIFKFNEDTRTFDNSNFLKVQFIYAPLVIGFMFFAGWFWGTKSPYSDTPGMSKSDWVTLRRDLEIAGLDPDKVPVGAFSSEQIKNMSKSDWYHLGMDLEIAGYDVKKKNRK